ncbi:exocyst complex component sec3 domain-containing protein [Phthorimaea operculella]|nr:exocyst complex component sec3 domain-containing protein [Phthorimaea operculella]
MVFQREDGKEVASAEVVSASARRQRLAVVLRGDDPALSLFEAGTRMRCWPLHAVKLTADQPGGNITVEAGGETLTWTCADESARRELSRTVVTALTEAGRSAGEARLADTALSALLEDAAPDDADAELWVKKLADRLTKLDALNVGGMLAAATEGGGAQLSERLEAGATAGAALSARLARYEAVSRAAPGASHARSGAARADANARALLAELDAIYKWLDAPALQDLDGLGQVAKYISRFARSLLSRSGAARADANARALLAELDAIYKWLDAPALQDLDGLGQVCSNTDSIRLDSTKPSRSRAPRADANARALLAELDAIYKWLDAPALQDLDGLGQRQQPLARRRLAAVRDRLRRLQRAKDQLAGALARQLNNALIHLGNEAASDGRAAQKRHAELLPHAPHTRWLKDMDEKAYNALLKLAGALARQLNNALIHLGNEAASDGRAAQKRHAELLPHTPHTRWLKDMDEKAYNALLKVIESSLARQLNNALIHLGNEAASDGRAAQKRHAELLPHAPHTRWLKDMDEKAYNALLKLLVSFNKDISDDSVAQKRHAELLPHAPHTRWLKDMDEKAYNALLKTLKQRRAEATCGVVTARTAHTVVERYGREGVQCTAQIERSLALNLNNALIHLGNEAASDGRAAQKRHAELLPHAPHTRWLKDMDEKAYNALLKVYVNAWSRVLEREIKTACDTARAQLSSAPPEKVDEILDQVLNLVETLCNAEQDFCTQFFHLDVDVKTDSSDGERSEKSDGGDNSSKKPSAETKRLMAELFPTLDTELVALLNQINHDAYGAMRALACVGRRVMAPGEGQSSDARWSRAALASVAVAAKRQADKIVADRITALPDAVKQASKRPKCGVLSFVAEFEELSRACEAIFLKNARRADLERWYLTLATAMLHAIHHADHPRTPKAIVHMGNWFSFMNAIFLNNARRADLERWYLTLATAMLHAIHHADHPRTPKAIVHMAIFLKNARRADLERWYLTLATAMLHAIHHADHPRTPKAIVHMGEDIYRVLERWYLTLATAMLHAIHHADHPRTPKAIVHMGEDIYRVLERWYLTLATAMLHAIHHADHPRTPKAIVHMGEDIYRVLELTWSDGT